MSRSRPIRTRRRCSRREGACKLPAAGFCRRGARAEEGPGRGCGRARLHAARRRLRGNLLRAWRRPDSRFLPRVPADGGGADLCGEPARGQDRPHRGAIRQAALGGHGNAERRGAAELPGRHHQRYRLHARGAHARSAADAQGLPAIGGDAQFTPRLRARRLCRPRAGAPMDAGLRAGQPRREPL